MDDPSPKQPNWLEKLGALLLREPEDREQLINLLRGAYERHLFDAEALAMIEGVLQVSEMRVEDIMIPRAQIEMVNLADSPEKIAAVVRAAGHSRYPVYDGSRDQIIGILLAKELLGFFADPDNFDLRDTLRPVVFVPESKRLNVLLKEFRSNRNHMAVVVDEYGGVAGLVTIEDVLEQIVGDIEDEYDFDETEDNLLQDAVGRYRVKAVTELEDFNDVLGTQLADDEFDTIGGWVVHQFGHVPKRGEAVERVGLRFEVLRADSRRVHSLLVTRLPQHHGK